jgi:Skp family chaperone for outer membrane proteins
MKRLVILAAAIAIAPFASAQLYKYVDKDGKTVYSDQPPANTDSKQINVHSPAPAATPDAPKTYVERDKELQKGRDEAREKAKKADLAGKQAQAKDEVCAQARIAAQHYADGGRIYKYNDKGERELLGDEEIEAQRARANRDVEEACKK